MSDYQADIERQGRIDHIEALREQERARAVYEHRHAEVWSKLQKLNAFNW